MAEGAPTFGRCDRHWSFRLMPAASGRQRLGGLPQSVRQAFSPALAVVEQGSALSMRHRRESSLLTVLKFST